MGLQHEIITELKTLNQIAETLNRAADVESALSTALARLIELMGLQTGWIFLRDAAAQDAWAGKGYRLGAAHCLPAAMAAEHAHAWKGGCSCQTLHKHGKLTNAYNEVRCSRLESAEGDAGGLVVHASVPLRSGERELGILNVAAPEWEAFSPQALALLTTVGAQMGIALERALLFDVVQERRLDEQAALLELSNQLLARLELGELMAYLVQTVTGLAHADACALFLTDAGGDLVCRAATGWRRDPVQGGLRLAADGSTLPAQVLATQQPVLIEDVSASKADAGQWLCDEDFRACAVVPLLVEGGAIGCLILNTRAPAQLQRDELRFLRLMANQAALAIEKARLHREALRRQKLEEELEVARRIQHSLLPEAPPQVPGWECASLYRSARAVSGDFYDFYHLPDGRLGLLIADVADKGVPAALFMAMCRTIIRTVALSEPHPAAVLCRANDLILSDSRSGLYLSAFYATLDTASGWLAFANAGHNRPLWLQRATGEIHELRARGMILAVQTDVSLQEMEVALAPGDVVVFYTDGLTEAMNAHNEEFGEERLQRILQQSPPDANADALLTQIVAALDDFTGDTPQFDDLTLFVVRRQI